jgi:Base plate wedge protein 53
MATYSNTSPYSLTKEVNGYLDILNFRDIPAQADDLEFVVTDQYSNRPDLLAYDLYGDVNLWWVFSIRNKDSIKDPIYDLVAGITIFLPKLSTLKSALGI